MPVRTSSARWEGTLREGKGSLKVGDGFYEGPYNYVSRFEEGDETNPEELIGAAHAGCYNMALSARIAKAGFDPESIETEAHVHLEEGEITRVVLDVVADVEGMDDAEFQDLAEDAKENCPVSVALSGGPEIELNASLA